MKIAIISDSHDNLTNIKKAISFIKKEKIKIIIHCGDICGLGTLKEGFENFSGKVHLVLGNIDKDYFKSTETPLNVLTNVKIWGEVGEIEVEKKKIAFCHFPELAKDLAQNQKYDLVFYGHTHKPWEEKIGKTRLINPGNLAGLFYRPTFAIYDIKTDKLELKILS